MNSCVQRFFQDMGEERRLLGATWLCHLLEDFRALGRWCPGPLANLVFAVAVFACVVFLLLNRKRDLIGHLYYWTHIGIS